MFTCREKVKKRGRTLNSSILQPLPFSIVTSGEQFFVWSSRDNLCTC